MRAFFRAHNGYAELITARSRLRALIGDDGFRCDQLPGKGLVRIRILRKNEAANFLLIRPTCEGCTVPVEAKPLFRPDVLRPRLAGFFLPGDVTAMRETLGRWARLLWSPQAETLKEQELLPDFLTDVFCGVLGYARAVDSKDRYTFSRKKHVQVDGKFADAVLGELTPGHQRFLVAVEGKGPKDPLDRPFMGRKMSAVDQGYRYAINLPCERTAISSWTSTSLGIFSSSRSPTWSNCATSWKG